METNPFDGKARHYEKYRVGYPAEAIAVIVTRAKLTGGEVVVDLGSGTGLLTRRLFPHVALIHGVEPSEDMRAVAVDAYRHEPKFRSVAGSAERTGLPAACADAVVSGNAFHYFDPAAAHEEVSRILRPAGRVAILFHDAPAQPDPFTSDYLAFLKAVTPPQLSEIHSTEAHEARLARFFGGRTTARDEGIQIERLSWDEMRGRFLSTSIAPVAAGAEYEAALTELRAVFDRHARGGVVPLMLSWTCVSSTAQ